MIKQSGIRHTMEDKRLIQLTDWLHSVLTQRPLQVTVASADASFRRYFRVEVNGCSWVAMDAPPDKENCEPFIRVAKAFHTMQMNVPEICAEDLAQGFLLLTDFGDINLLDKLDAASVDALYGDALLALLTLQINPKPQNFTLPPYNEALLSREMDLFNDWFIEKHIGTILDESERINLQLACNVLVKNALEQPKVCVHRDYHSRNLMITEKNNPGVIDFQDAVHGPITYDLVSLLRDCYIDWPVERVESWAISYLEKLKKNNICNSVSNETFLKWFDLMGVQRHLKAIGIFSRLNYRDGKSHYLNDIPRTLNYVRQVSARHEELSGLHQLINERVLPAMGELN